MRSELRRWIAWCSAIAAALACAAEAAPAGLAERIKAWSASLPIARAETRDELAAISDGMCAHLLSTARTVPDVNWLRPAILLQREGDKHPLVLLAVAYLSEVDPSIARSGPLYAEAIRALRDSKAPDELLFAALRRASGEARTERDETTADGYDRLAIGTYLALASAPDAGERLDALTLNGMNLAEDLPLALGGEFIQRLDAAASVDECLRETVGGVFDVQAAWGERGTRYAYKTSDAEFNRFDERLRKASDRLRKAWQLDPRRPYAAAALITVAMGGGTPRDESIETWFARAMEARDDYYQAYSKVLWALRPRWGGSHEAMLEFGRRALEQGRFDTGVPNVYLDAIVGVLGDGGDLAMLRPPAVLANIERIADGNQKSGIASRRQTTDLLRILCLVERGDHAAARAVLDEPGFSWSESLALRVGVVPSVVERDVRALASAARDAVQAGDAAFKGGRFGEASSQYRAALKELTDRGAPEAELAAVRSRLATAEMTAAYESGEWVERCMQPNLPGWARLFGQWWWDGNSLIGGGQQIAPKLALLVPLGPRYECRCRLREGGRRWANAEVALFLNYTPLDDDVSYRSVSWYPNQREIRLWGRRAAAPIVVKVPSKEARVVPPLELDIQVWDESIVIKSSGKTLYAGPLPVAPVQQGGVLAVGARWPLVSDASVQFSDFSIRKLTTKPLELQPGAATATATTPAKERTP